MEYVKLNIKVDKQTHKKIKNFSFDNDIAHSEVIRVLIEKAPLKLNTRDKKAIQNDSKTKKLINDNLLLLYLTKELRMKLKKMISTNETSGAEIIRVLINNSNIQPSMFKTKSEVATLAKKKG